MLNNLIGNTPLIKIKYEYIGNIKEVYTKLEYYNLSGSIKDRVVYYILEDAIKHGQLKENTMLIEATSGNTGISLASLGAYYRYPVTIFMPDWASIERLNLMKLYNAKVITYKKEEGGFKRCIEEAIKLKEKTNGFLLNQFSNEINKKAHYETTAKEILDKIKVDGFISGIGTGGTLMGIAERLKEANQNVKIYALEPKTMSLLKNGIKTHHQIEGIADDFIPDLVDINKIDDVIVIDDIDAIKMSQKLASSLGLGVGISSGGNLLASILMHEVVKGNIVTVFPDDNKKYLSTNLCKEINKKSIVDDIKFLNYEVII